MTENERLTNKVRDLLTQNKAPKSYYDNESQGRKDDNLRFQTKVERQQDEIKIMKERREKERKEEIYQHNKKIEQNNYIITGKNYKLSQLKAENREIQKKTRRNQERKE